MYPKTSYKLCACYFLRQVWLVELYTFPCLRNPMSKKKLAWYVYNIACMLYYAGIA